jgi:hypothetical protein
MISNEEIFSATSVVPRHHIHPRHHFTVSHTVNLHVIVKRVAEVQSAYRSALLATFCFCRHLLSE